MIDINLNNNNYEPYLQFVDFYNKALELNQQSIEAIQISSFDKKLQEVDSRFVNLKYLAGEEFIFFSNYTSPKANQFLSHDQISAVIYWSSINVQVRMKAKIFKTSSNFSDLHFSLRGDEKNALAVSSNQSSIIKNYNEVEKKYKKILNNSDKFNVRPDYWGGFTFIPYYFEFWTGHKSRINKREVFQKKDNDWQKSILEP